MKISGTPKNCTEFKGRQPTDEQEAALNFFYPLQQDFGGEKKWLRSWRGFEGLHEPCVPSRLFSPFLDSLRSGLRGDTDSLEFSISFLRSSHRKFLSQSGTGREDVDAVPTNTGLEGANLLEEFLFTLKDKTKCHHSQ